MGMSSPFNPDLADFSGMTGERNLFIHSIVHTKRLLWWMKPARKLLQRQHYLPFTLRSAQQREDDRESSVHLLHPRSSDGRHPLRRAGA
jgi:hypothetical protein